ncbi:MAG: PAS domain-containing protein, partial [Synergistaceae bacterium]|nr:PAS domain-containing protein [Synergistaceae bacterium]
MDEAALTDETTMTREAEGEGEASEGYKPSVGVSLLDDAVCNFIDSLNEIILLVDENRDIIAASGVARALFGLSPEGEAPNIENLFPKVYIDSISHRMKGEDAKRMTLTFPAKAADGHEVLLEARFNWFQAGNENLLSITCRDITDFMKAMSDLTDREDRYRTIFRESPLGFIHVNSDGYITDCNNAFLAIFGLDRSEVIDVCLAEDNDLD